MNRIDQIHINNFKFFGEEKPIELGGNHLLLYGENGSGKSSIYWALYTLFEAPFKNTDADLERYFRKGEKEVHSLVNIHAKEQVEGKGNYDSFISVTTDNPATTFRLAKDELAIRTREDAKLVNFASDFIQYKLLHSMTNFWHSEPIDLHDFFVDHTLQHVKFPEIRIRRNENDLDISNGFDFWRQLRFGLLTLERGEEEFKELLDAFNAGMQKLIDFVNQNIEHLIKKIGYTNFKFHLNYFEADYANPDDVFQLIPFSIELVISEYEGKPMSVHRAHSFLNEAKLNAIGISIRLAVLLQKVNHEGLKFIVLDDLLISLDMRNRERVLDLLLSDDFAKNYQLLILTHDQYFFQMAKQKIKRSGQEDWVYFEMYETSRNGIAAPLIRKSLSYIELADVCFSKRNYDGAGNFLRKATEEFCKEFVPFRLQVDKNFDKLDASGLLDAAIKFAKNNDLNKMLFQDLQEHREFIFNPLSHDSYDVPRFRTEIEKCFITFQKLTAIKFKTAVEKDSDLELHFEMLDKDGTTKYRTEFIIYDELRLIQEPSTASILTRGLMLQKKFKNGILFSSQYTQDSLKRFYDNWFRTSDGKANADYWEGITLTKTNQPLKSLRAF